MPGGYQRPVTLYRGDDARRRRIHGFSWPTDIEVARKFAKQNMIPPLGDGGGTLTRGLDGARRPGRSKTTAPASSCVIKTGRRSYCYYEEEPGRRAAASLMTRDEARTIALNIAKLPELLP